MEELAETLKKHLHHEPVDLKHVGNSDFYVDVKEAMGKPVILNQIVDEMYMILDSKTTCVAGGGYGGSYVPVLASRYGLRFCMIRDEPKEHGRDKGRIEHYVPTSKDKVAVLDDVLSSGKSLYDIGTVILNETKAKIVSFNVVVKRGELRYKLSAPLKYLIDVKELLK